MLPFHLPAPVESTRNFFGGVSCKDAKVYVRVLQLAAGRSMSSTAKRNLTVAILFLTLLVGISIAGIVTKFRFDPQQAAFWDICIKAVGGFVAIAGALLTLAKYLDDKYAALRKPFADLRGTIYSKLIHATATLGNYPRDSNEWRAAEKSFWVLFWGELPLIEDDAVAAMVDKFESAMRYEEMDSQEEQDNLILLRNLSMDLARTCRKSLGFDDLK